jgi:hypothetical protein
MPVNPFRLRVQKALSARLEEIVTTAEGQLMANRVFRGRVIFGADDPIPMLSILEEPIQEDPNDSPPAGKEGITIYRLMIQGFVPDDLNNPTDPAHFLQADVLVKLAQIKAESEVTERVFDFPDKAPTVTGIDFGPGVVRPPDSEISAQAYFWLTISLELAEKYDAPFA